MKTSRGAVFVGLFLLLMSLLFLASEIWYSEMEDRGLDDNFNPARLAAFETRMWQDYYAGRGKEMAMEMVALTRAQFGASRRSVYEICEPMARGAMAFRGQGNAREQVLPYLEQSYARLARACGKDWDAKALAEAELAWWVARRTPGQDSPEQVGALIAKLYALLYGATNRDIERAGLLRAQAAGLRDAGGANADWAKVEALLVDSYTALHAGIQAGR